MRRLAILLGCLFGAALIALVALPWWLGPVLKSVGPARGLTFSSYERVGYTRFALRDVVVARLPVRVSLQRFEADTPVLWLWRHWAGTARMVSGTSWQVDVVTATKPKPSEVSSGAPAKMGAMRLRRLLLKIATGLERWLPQAEIGPGSVRWPTGSVALEAATWRQRTLLTKNVRYAGLTADVKGEFPADGEIRAEAIAGQAWRATARNRETDLVGEVHVWQQTATLSVRFVEQGWLPAEAHARAKTWEVPGAQLKLGALYAFVRGSAALDWRDGTFETTVEVKGEPLPQQKAPPLEATLRGRGDTQSLTIEALALTLPGLKAQLSAPMVFDRRGQIQAGTSRFTLEANLAEQPWFTGQGRVTGEARLTSPEGKPPQVDFTLEGREITAGEWSVPGVTAQALLDWPRLEVKNATVVLAENSSIGIHGSWNFQTKELSGAEAEGTINGALLARWLPAGMAADTASVKAKAEGSWKTLRHEGRALFTKLSLGKAFHPVALSVNWKGEGPAAEISAGEIRAGSSQITFAGKVENTGAEVTALRLVQGETERLKLAQPVAIRWSPSLQIGPMQLAGPTGTLAFEAVGGPVGRVSLEAHHLPSQWWTDLVVLPGPAWQISVLAIKGEWNRGPLTYTAQSEVELAIGPERAATLALVARGDGTGLRLESLRVSEGAEPIVTASGQLPLTVYPGTSKVLRVDERGQLVLSAATTSNPEFWKKITALTGFELEQPELNLHLSGTWNQPRGEIQARVRRAAADPKRIKHLMPTIELLDAHATADGHTFTLDRFSVQLDGQKVQGTAQLPLTAERWNELQRDPLAYVRGETTGQLLIPDADLAALARYLPRVLAPKGRLELKVSLNAGGEVAGMLRVRDAASRPLGPLGLLQEINAEVSFSGRTAELRGVTAKTGGQPVTLAGKVTWPKKGDPTFDLTLKGENLPFVRKTGLLLRGDLDLKLGTDVDGTPRLGGAVRLRDSIFLSDIRALIPHGATGPARHPPYFAVESGPLMTWRLAIEVTGEKFLRLRTVIFAGVASARFKLGGTLGEPRLTGEAVVDRGQVLLPFALFKVQQGAVRLTEADPYEPRLSMTGISRRYGYDLRMLVSGTASVPVVTFTSSPPLDAEQVLRMVMTGETPRNEITYTGNQRFARLGTYLGQNLINTFGGDVADEGRLSIATGEKVSRQGRETYEIEYGLNDRFTLVGEYDEFDDYNLGIKWRVFGGKNPDTPTPQRDEKK